MPMPEPVRLPRLRDLSAANLPELAAQVDSLVDGIMSAFYRAQEEQARALKTGTETFGNVVRSTNARVLALVQLLNERKYVRPKDAERLKELIPVMEKSLADKEAQNAQVAADLARVNEVLDWLERSRKLYGG